MQRYSLRALGISLVLGLTIGSGEAFAQRLYRWVDENGQKHFSATLPPEAAKRGYQELDQRGRVVRSHAPQKTTAELERERELKHQAQAKARAEAEQRDHDQILLQSYGSVDDLIQARDSRLATIESYISVSEKTLGDLKQQLDQQQRQLARIRDEEAKADQQKAVEVTEKQIQKHQALIEKRRKEQSRIRAQMNSDISRYRELTQKR